MGSHLSSNKTTDHIIFQENVREITETYIKAKDHNNRTKTFTYAPDIQKKAYDFLKDNKYKQFALSVYDDVVYAITVDMQTHVMSSEISPGSGGFVINIKNINS